MTTGSDVERVLAGGGEAGALARSIDWSRTPIGPVERWSQALRSTAALVLHNHAGLLLWWGPSFVQIYNDAYRPVLGEKHPRAMGQPVSECWSEIWHIIGPMIESPFRGGPASTSDDLLLPLRRKNFLEEAHFRVAYSPVPDDSVETGIGGVLATVTETTEQMYGERQLRVLRELGARAASEVTTTTAERACAAAAATLAGDPWDVPFALFYLLDDSGEHARLVANVGFDPARLHEAAPAEIDLADGGCRWPLREVTARRSVAVIAELDHCRDALPRSPWSERPTAAIALALASPDQANAYGVLICGVSPHRVLDTGYRAFFELTAGQVVTAIRNARALQEERKRAEALAEIDRAKTAFFSNVSHEFRTPLTLMLGPTEDALRTPERALGGEALETVHRNELRLLKLVNALLDFSRIEAGRMQAQYTPTDLAARTRELAGVFRAAIERAGLGYRVACGPLDQPIFVDVDMWEKIVLNLLSNALKFTFDGEIEVRLDDRGTEVALTVRDTGTGVPASELPRLFERFHRVEGVVARTHEGSGIGLALVNDLVRLHGGRVDATSEVGVGTTFTVWIPKGTNHLDPARIGSEAAWRASTGITDAFVQEAMRWLPDVEPAPAPSGQPPEAADDSPRGRVLVADDNADMREYVTRLLRPMWEVTAVGDGEAALAAARARPPDLVLSDVMMPKLDGFGLLAELRRDPVTRSVPVVMLSARAGEESRIDGLQAGADDYLVKPFSARELIARVRSQIELSRARQQAIRADRRKDEFLAMLSHELRNPLAPILTILELVELRGTLTRHDREVLDRQVRHLMRLVDDLLDISRIARGKIELDRKPIAIAGALHQAIDMATPLLEHKGIALAYDRPPDDIVVAGDQVRLAQVFGNVLANAAHYTPAGGQVVVRVDRTVDTVSVAIRDNGSGIAPDVLPRIFELFEQGPRDTGTHRGLGVGLSICRSLVELHAGTITAASDGPGRGSEFVITLPIYTAADRAVAPGPRSHIDGARVAKNVLVVDDNADAAELLADALSLHGYRVTVSHDGERALEVMARLHHDIVVLDIGLPGIDGYEVARRIRQLEDGKLSRVVALSGYGRTADRAKSKASGFDAHLVKPIDIQKLLVALETAP